MTWSAEDAFEQRKNALRFLLDNSTGEFTRSLDWCEQSDSGIPDGVWSLLLEEKFIQGNIVGGAKWRLTVPGWIEACRLLRDEIGLDKRFGILSAHLKTLAEARTGGDSSTRAIAEQAGLSEVWVFDAICGRMAELIYAQHGATVIDKMGGVDIPPHIGNKRRST